MRAIRTICRHTAIGLVLLSVVLVGCSPASGRPPVVGEGGAGAQRPAKHLTAVIRGEPYTLSEAINAAGSGSVPGVAELQELIHAGLAVDDDSRNLRPRLAEDVPSVTNGQWIVQADGRMRTTWKLKPGVVWQDGTPFTSSDLVFSTEVARDKQVALAADTAFGIIDHVEAPDATTFVVYWVKPFVNADRLFTRAGGSRVLPMPRHLLESDFREDPSTLSQVSYWTHDFVGLGPYQVKEFVESSHLILQASDSYVLGRPRIDEIEVKFMLDPSTIAANIVAGAVEFTLGGRYSLEWGLQVRDQWKDGRMEAPVASTWVALFPQFLNPTPAVLSELSFRQALLSAINRQEMSDTIQAGLSPIADSIIAPGEPEYSDVESRIVRYSFDTRRAASQIEELGFTKGADGVYADASGRKLNIEIRTRQGDDLQEKTLFGVAGYWQQLGLGVDPLIFPPQRAPDREFRSTRPAFEVVRQPSGVDALARYHGGSTPLPENGYRGLNRTRYQNPSFDALIEKYLTTIPKKERNDTVGEIVNYMSGQVLVLGIYWALDPVMISNRLTNVSNQNTTWNANEWDVRT